MSLSSATSRFCSSLLEISPAPLLGALALLGVAGLFVHHELPASPAPVTVPLSEGTGKTLPLVHIRLDSEGSVYHQGRLVTEEDFVKELSEAEAAVVVHADRNASVPALLEVMRWLKLAGIKHTAVDSSSPSP